MDYKVTISGDNLERLGPDVKKGIEAGMANLGEEIEARAKLEEAPHAKTSNLVNGISNFLAPDGKDWIVRASAKNEQGHDYASDVFEGTGIYGPSGRRITPKNKKALFWPGAAHPVRSVKGFKGRHAFDVAIGQISPEAVVNEGIQNFLTTRGW